MGRQEGYGIESLEGAFWRERRFRAAGEEEKGEGVGCAITYLYTSPLVAVFQTGWNRLRCYQWTTISGT